MGNHLLASDAAFRQLVLNANWQDDGLQRLVQFAYGLCVGDEQVLQRALPGGAGWGGANGAAAQYVTVFAYLHHNVLSGEQFHQSYTWAFYFVHIVDEMLTQLNHEHRSVVNNIQKHGQDAARMRAPTNEFRDLMLLVAALYSSNFFTDVEVHEHWKTWENFVHLSGVELHKDCHRDLYVPYMKMVGLAGGP